MMGAKQYRMQKRSSTALVAATWAAVMLASSAASAKETAERPMPGITSDLRHSVRGARSIEGGSQRAMAESR